MPIITISRGTCSGGARLAEELHKRLGWKVLSQEDVSSAAAKAYRMTEKAAALGFDWKRPADVLHKLHEEVEELEAEVRSEDPSALDRVRGELGDVLFVMANLARHLGVEPETALQGTNEKFLRRFRAMEEAAAVEGRSLRDHDLEELDGLWERAKEAERR